MHDELTKEDIKKIQEEIDYRKFTLAPKLRDEVSRTRAFGDTSENFEYRSAKSELNKNYSRIEYLQRMIDTAIVIETKKKKDVVTLYDKVTLFNEDKNKEMVVTFVTTIRQDSTNMYISKKSPLGKACVGHKKGERVFVKINDTKGYYCTIVDIVPGEDDGTLDISSY